MAKAFTNVEFTKPKRSSFDLSYDNKFTTYMGKLYPFFCQEVIPGDSMDLGAECVIRCNPMVAPLMHRLDIKMRWFFVANRTIWDDWIEFISTGADGTSAPSMPLWDDYKTTPAAKGTIWDALGLGLVATPEVSTMVQPDYFIPTCLPRRVYNKIYNEYYRDENIQEEVDTDNNAILNCNFTKNDYFMSALPFAQKGITPALPLLGSAPVVFDENLNVKYNFDSGVSSALYNSCDLSVGFSSSGVSAGPARVGATGSSTTIQSAKAVNTYISKDDLSANNYADLSGATAGTIDDLRMSFALQEFMEKNAIGGNRYTELIYNHFAVFCGDARVDRAEYLGSIKSQFVVTDIPQTSATTDDSAQGNLAGKGLAAFTGKVRKFFAREHGYIMGIMTIMPKLSYVPQGIDKKYIKHTYLDYFWPSFARLGEQPIKKGELFLTGTDSDDLIFGYQGIYAEYRHNRDIVAGDMRDTYDYYHLARKFGSQPSLNSDLIECKGDTLEFMRVFEEQTTAPFIVDVYNVCHSSRLIPTFPTPSKLVV